MKKTKSTKLWPSLIQWCNWGLPSKWSLIGGCAGILSLFITILTIIFGWPPWPLKNASKIAIKQNNTFYQENIFQTDSMNMQRFKIHLLPQAFATNMEIRFGDDVDFQKLCESPEQDIFTECIIDLPLNKFQHLKIVSEYPHNQTVQIIPKKQEIDPFDLAGYYQIDHSIIENPTQDSLYTSLFEKITVNNFTYNEYRKIDYPLLRISITARKRVIEKVIKKDNHWVYDRRPLATNEFELKTKIFFLEVMNTFLKEVLNVEYSIKYNDISSFFLIYSKSNYPLYLCSYFLTSKTDYLVLFDIYFTKDVREQVEKSTNEFRKLVGVIDSEQKLYETVLFAIEEIKHETDNRRLYQPFWDNLKSGPTPKRELDIQPILTTFMRFILEREFGIDISSNVNEGIGNLDYKFSYSFNKKKYNVVVELKLADHSNLWHGLENQLPSYMRSVRTNHGIFWVLWHKTPRVYSLPVKYKSKIEFDEDLKRKVNEIKKKTGFNIAGITCDVSIRNSASKI